jgi:hypothetical protein
MLVPPYDLRLSGFNSSKHLLLGITTPLPSHIEKRSLLSKQKEMTQTGY